MAPKIKIIILGLGHFFVDLLGLYLIHNINNYFSFEYIGIYFVIYNLIAFGFQPVFGYLADKYNLYFYFVILGLLLPIIAVIFPSLGVIAIIVSTIGNAMFHVGGGVISVNLFPNKVMPTGLFVAPGALGVFFGIYLASKTIDYRLYLTLIPLVITLITYFVFKDNLPENKSDKVNKNLMSIAILVMAIVFLRGFIGYNLVLPWKGQFDLGLSLVIGVFLGKFLGGILADKFGLKKIAITGLIVSLPLLLLGYEIPIVGIVGAVFFNLTMAVTLYVIIYSFGKHKGFAFGLTTLALFISTLPTVLGFSFDFNVLYIIIMAILFVLAIILLNILFRKYEEEENV